MTDDFLAWPFFDDRHRELAERLESWCEAELSDDQPDDVDQACRTLVRKLGDGGWLRYCVPDPEGRIDVRSLALIRETLARHDGLADFAFAMQGLARSLAAGPTFAHGITKTQLNTEWAVSLETAIEMEAQAQAICMATNDFRRAFEAFAAKKTPEFKGD